MPGEFENTGAGTTFGTTLPRTETSGIPSATTGSLGESESSVAGAGVEQAKRVTHAARDRAVEKADRQMDTIANRISSFASKLEGSATEMQGPEGELTRRAASFLRRASDDLQGKSVDDLVSGAKRQLRERPALVTAGLVAIGFIGGRLLRD